MIMEVNLLDQSFNSYQKAVKSKTFQPPAKIQERMHQTVGNVLRTLLHGQPPQQIMGACANDFIDKALAITMHAIRAGMHSTLGSSPGSLVFNGDMFLNIILIVDWHVITKWREHLVNENLMHDNRKRCRHDYAVDHRVSKKHHNPTKLGPRTSGPYRVVQTHVNRTVTIELRQGVTERINIRRIIPFMSNKFRKLSQRCDISTQRRIVRKVFPSFSFHQT